MNYYNEHNPKAAAWLRELIKAGHIPNGFVDTRDIQQVRPADLDGYIQCHFFAGIGGWPYALRLAGWPDHRPVWTGSLPCQPFSQAGKRRGAKDSRHLFPVFHSLIAQRNPSVVFGEQVASKAGRLWLSRVRTQMETLAYAFGAADLCAAGISAPHIRQRLFWVADAEYGRGRIQMPGREKEERTIIGRPRKTLDRLPHSHTQRCQEFDRAAQPIQEEHTRGEHTRGEAGGMADADRSGQVQGSSQPEERPAHPFTSGTSTHPGLANPNGCHEHWWSGPLQVGWNCIEGEITRGGRKHRAQWRIKPGLSLLAHGIPGRVDQICGFGNAIVPLLAAEFIQAYLETRP